MTHLRRYYGLYGCVREIGVEPSAVASTANFHLLSGVVSVSGDEDIEQVYREREETKRSETAEIILEYFGAMWPRLKLYRQDLTADEIGNWNKYDKETIKRIRNRVRTRKLEVLKGELQDSELVKFTERNERREYRRRRSLELCDLLLARIATE